MIKSRLLLIFTQLKIIKISHVLTTGQNALRTLFPNVINEWNKLDIMIRDII